MLDAIADTGVPRIHFGVTTGELLPQIGAVGADVVVMDMAGSLVWEGAVTAGQMTIPTEVMQAGAYILSWTAEGVTGRQRFIVQ